MDEPQCFEPRRRLQDLLLLDDVQAEHRRQQVRQPERILRGGQHLLHVDGALRLRQFDRLGRQVEDGSLQRVDFRAFVLGQGHDFVASLKEGF